ncbi:MAG: DUF4142 domain-containing protein [Hyphomicrobiales bacterium]|nr:DUF4142 domain-containing protein [Hyphomicrobiales bacterium]
MTRLPLLSLLAVSLCAYAAAAQSTDPAKPAPGNPAGSPSDTRETVPGVPAPGQANVPDRAFLRAAALGGRAEVQFGKLAETKAASEAVQNFARRMIHDHSAANDRLSSLGAHVNVALPPDQLDPDHKAIRARLDSESGANFDKEYVNTQIADHQATAQLFEYEIGSGQDAQLKAFASDELPVIFEHLQMARALSATLAAETMASASRSPN